MVLDSNSAYTAVWCLCFHERTWCNRSDNNLEEVEGNAEDGTDGHQDREAAAGNAEKVGERLAHDDTADSELPKERLTGIVNTIGIVSCSMCR